MASSHSDEPNLIDAQPEWWRENLLAIGGGFVLLALIGAGIVLWQNRINLRDTEAILAVRQAPTTETKLQNAKQFLDVPAIGPELLILAAAQYEEDNHQGAIDTYSLFLANYSDHSLNNAARFGQAVALDAAGQPDKALSGYLAVADHRPADAYNPMGLLYAARYYQAQGDIAKRKEMLSRLAKDYADSIYGQQAGSQLAALGDTSQDAPAETAPAAPADTKTAPAPTDAS